MKALKLLPFIIVAALAGCGEKTPTAATAPAAPAAAPAPAPAPAPAAEAPAAVPAAEPAAVPAVSTAGADDLAKGEKVFGTSCAACHGAGVMGAPKLGDKAAWEPRIAKGKDAVYANAINGVKMMPPRGGNAGLKDDEMKAAVDFMISKVK